ncbi:MAG: malto-oligosyltrehalose synthase [Gemmatimonadaceae bacterium]|nr:malto-oligosyltrehalose synthase [Chitinophagaceae bacterium]
MMIPSCTYRIQFNRDFNFKHLEGIIDYLEDLGVTSIYASPLLQATMGSSHGYDGIDPSLINVELGTLEELEALTTKLKTKGISWIQDIVPNHLAFNTDNVWLKDVLERGVNSSYAGHFDIDWAHPFYQQKLMVPFLEAGATECVSNAVLKLAFTSEGFFIAYHHNLYPVNIDNYPLLLSGVFGDEFNHVNASISALVNNAATDYSHWKSLKNELLSQLTDDGIAQKIQEKIDQINADKDLLLQIVNNQHYILSYHMVSNTQVNYRRFFNVNGLICLKIEDEKVFNDYHQHIYTLFEKNLIQGLRIDHIDGLKNPREYIDRLRTMFGPECYIIVEKILDVKEELPADFDIQGTSGYEFLSYINQVITDHRGAEKLLALYNKYVPEFSDYDEIVYKNKLSNLESYLNGEWDNLLRMLLSLNLIEDEELKINHLKNALGVFMACFPVYRAYIETLPLTDHDEKIVGLAFEKAYEKLPEQKTELDVIREIFTPHEDPVKSANRLLFIQRLMQFTGPLAAKGVEDTTFYLYNPLISHNEVGDQPCVLGIPVRQFHEKMIERQLKNPLSMNCTSTHDTKRGEDGRIRINIISELTEEWTELVAYWQKINEPYRKQLGELRAPIVNDEYFLYQAIVGGFPENLQLNDEFVSRTKTYYTKVLRESKQLSDYVNPNVEYEQACTDFISHLLDPTHKFLPSLIPFVKKLIGYANIYTMVQVIIKTTAPGIPDIYRGCELWDISYVDPDNRRPVDWDLRKRLLRELDEKKSESIDAMLSWANSQYEVGAQKIFVTREMLQLRKRNKDLFIYGEYIPIYGEGSERVVIAFLRHYKNRWVLIVLPLGIVANTGKELSLALPAGAPENWSNIFTGEAVSGNKIDVHRLFSKFPLAVLENN